MTQNNPIDPRTRCYQEAVEWLFCLQEDCPTNQQIIEWVEWCRADPENRHAFEQLMPAWTGLKSFSDDPATVALAGTAVSEQRSRHWSLFGQAVRQPRNWLALAASVAMAVGAVFFWQANRIITLDPVATLASRIGQVREANLPDGSHIDLGARSELAINFQGTRRQIDLKDGEAFFAVKHDKTRPFVVQAGPLQVVAVGTAFDVRRSGERVRVTVEQGIVEVTADPSGDADGVPRKLRISEGSQIVFDVASPGSPLVRLVDPQSAEAWRKGRFEYINEPLSAVIADLNRYSANPISFQDKRLGQLTFTGTIALHSIDEWLQALPRIFPVHVAYGSDNRIAIQARADVPP